MGVEQRRLSYARFLLRFGVKNACWFGDYCRFREVGLVVDALTGGLGDWRRPIRSLLDVGCAGTLFPYYAAALFPRARVVGIDSEANQELAPIQMLEQARRSPEADRVRIFPADARRLPFADAAFDAATAISVVEHIPGEGDIEAVREMARVVRPGGLIALTVPMSPEHAELESDPSCDYFIRRYDERTLRERLIEPAAPASATVRYLGEGRVAYSRQYLLLRSAQTRWMHRGPLYRPLRWLGWLALLATPLATRLFFHAWAPDSARAKQRPPGGAAIVLETMSDER